MDIAFWGRHWRTRRRPTCRAYASIYTNSICFAASFNTLQLNIRSLALAFSAALLFLGVEDSQELGFSISSRSVYCMRFSFFETLPKKIPTEACFVMNHVKTWTRPFGLGTGRVGGWRRRHTSLFQRASPSFPREHPPLCLHSLAIMFHEGTLQSGIALAIKEQKLVACFVRGI